MRKINFRYTLSAAVVFNLLKKENQILKFALGYSHENTNYENGAFVPSIDGINPYSKNEEQLYVRIKGEHTIEKFKISYDIFYQAPFEKLTDKRWLIIGNVDYSIAKHLAIRASAVNSYENFVATNVSKDNFRLTYGLNIQF